MVLHTIVYGRVTWVNIVYPTPADIEELREMFPYIHPLNLEDLRSPTERPKIDVQDQYLFVTMHFPQFDHRQSLSRAREVDFIIGRGYVVTVHDNLLKPMQTLYTLCDQSEAQRQRLLARGANHAFYVMIDMLVDYVQPILRKVDSNIREVEETIFSSDGRSIIQQIGLIRRDVIALRRIIRQQVPIIEQLERSEYPILREDMEEYFGDIADHLHRERDIIDENYEVINSLADTANTLATYRVNEVMRILTVMSVLMLPLTLISSIYGMNITLPLAEHPDSFLIVALTMIGIAVAMLLFFRRRGWL
ncbi:MAG: magnesium transporter CorA family protein [Anaerolineae bacterium]|jgi:magnesium transporter|nr:magnesium transporter CorA family protein [Anaerolineae bacterium]